MIRIFTFIILLSAYITGHAQTGINENAVLNPGFISGTVQIGNEVFVGTEGTVALDSQGSQFDARFFMRAESFDLGFDARASFLPNEGNPSQTVYTLTVNVPQGQIAEYSVNNSFTTNVFNPIFSDEGFDRFELSSQTALVTEFETTELNFNISNLGYVVGQVGLTEGSSLDWAEVTVTRLDGELNPSLKASTSLTNSDRAGEYRIAASPGEVRIECEGVVSINGVSIGVTADPQTQMVVEGEDIVFNCPLLVDGVFETFDLVGRVLVGGDEFRQHRLTLSGPTGPASERRVLILNADGSYAYEDLPLGRYSLLTETIYNGGNLSSTFVAGRQNLFHPNSSYSNPRAFDAEPGVGVIEIDIVAPIGFLTGDINFGGSFDPNLLSRLELRSDIELSSNTAGRTNVQPAISNDTSSIAYEQRVTEGSWGARSLRVVYETSGVTDADKFVSNSHLINYPGAGSRDEVLVEIGNPGRQDLDLEFGELVVNFSITGEDLSLNTPQILASCVFNGAEEQNIYSVNLSANGAGENGRGEPSSRTGSVRIVAPQGECVGEAFATVNGSRTEFGEFDFTVVPGVVVVIDLEGPRLTVQSPLADSNISNDNVDVIGLVTDDVGVESLTVNGIVATLIDTQNADDPNERAFNVNIPLAFGANQIVVEAFDAEGNQASNTRTVFRDDEAPTVEWIPADGSVFLSEGDVTIVDVIGTANDDTGVVSITVEGQSVEFISTSNAELPNEVSFNTVLELVNGLNFIEVVVVDVSGRQVMQVHRVDVIDNRAPLANAGPDQIIEQQRPGGAQVQLDGSASSDPDGDVLVFVWTFGEETFDGVAPNVELPAGVSVLTLRATDPSGVFSQDSVLITIQDTIPPVLTIPADVRVEATGVLSTVDIGVATAVDVVDGIVVVSDDAPSQFPLGETVVTYTASDAAGNTSTGTQIVIVEDTTAPEFDLKKLHTKLVYQPYGHNRFKLTTLVKNIHDAVDVSANVKVEVTGNQGGYYGRHYQNYSVRHHADKTAIWLKPEINRYSRYAGVYKVKVTVTDDSGNSRTQVCYVKVKKAYRSHKPKYRWFW